MEKYRVSNIAEALKTTTTTVYKHVRRLKNQLKGHTFEDRGIALFDQAGFDILRDEITKAQPVVRPVATVQDADEMKAALLEMAREISNLRAEVVALRKAQSPQCQKFAEWYMSFFRPVPARLETVGERYYFGNAKAIPLLEDGSPVRQ